MPKRSRSSSFLMTTTIVSAALIFTAPTRINAYITSGLPAHTHRAFLRKLTDDICNQSIGSLSPEEMSTCPMLMSAWATAPEKLNLSSDNGRERALAVEGLLKRMIDERRAGNAEAIAVTEDYNAVMKAWSMSGEGSKAAVRAEQILIQMQDLYQSGDKNVQPNLESFQIAIEAWTRASDEPNAPARAQQILEWMINTYKSGANDKAQPDTLCFIPVLKAWASSRKLEGPIMAEHLIMWMQQLQFQEEIESAKPTTLCFNIVMSSWLKSADITSEKRIRQIFEYMESSSKKGNVDVQPDAGSYNIVISSISPAVKKFYDMGGARRADKILARLESGYLNGDETLRPDSIIYNQVIDYWAKTQSVRGHFMKARDVLDRQVKMFREEKVRKCRPDVTGYTSVIAACASTYGTVKEKRRSFDMAHLTFMESCAEKYTQPNDVTYGVMFKAVGRLLNNSDEQDKYARTLFKLCCDDGFLGDMAFMRMKAAVSNVLYKELTGGKTYEELPEEWKRNVTKRQKKYDMRKNAAKKSNQLRP